jgi:hypothetical protein
VIVGGVFGGLGKIESEEDENHGKCKPEARK